jgi:hypothetical protein
MIDNLTSLTNTSVVIQQQMQDSNMVNEMLVAWVQLFTILIMFILVCIVLAKVSYIAGRVANISENAQQQIHEQRRKRNTYTIRDHLQSLQSQLNKLAQNFTSGNLIEMNNNNNKKSTTKSSKSFKQNVDHEEAASIRDTRLDSELNEQEEEQDELTDQDLNNSLAMH